MCIYVTCSSTYLIVFILLHLSIGLFVMTVAFWLVCTCVSESQRERERVDVMMVSERQTACCRASKQEREYVLVCVD